MIQVLDTPSCLFVVIEYKIPNLPIQYAYFRHTL